MISRPSLATTLWAVLTSCCPAADVRSETLSGLDDFVRQTMTATGIPGVALSVVRGGQVILARGYGVREAGGTAAVDKDTVFAIGSNSKYFTATALGLLVAEDRLSWDAPLTRYLPRLRFSDPYLFTQLTLRDALSHRTGLERGDLAWKFNPGLSRNEVLAQIEKLKLEIPFRSGFLYNNYMFVAAGEVIPAVTGISWDTFVKRRLLDPLDMHRTNTSVTDLEHMPNVAMPHAMADDRAKTLPYYDVSSVAPAGAINSSAADMAQWCKVQLGNGTLNGRQIIPKPVIDELRKPQTLRTLSEEGPMRTIHASYALGIGRSNFGPEHVVYAHDGGIDGMLSYFAFVPSAGVCSVVLTNGAPNYGLHSAIATWVLSRLLGLDTKDALARFNERLREEKAKKARTEQRHASSHDPAVKPTLASEAYAGTYTHELYGELTVEWTDGELWLTWGRSSRVRLRHHRADSFDFEHGQAMLDRTPMVLSFSADASGQVESALLQHLTEKPFNARFSKTQHGRLGPVLGR